MTISFHQNCWIRQASMLMACCGLFSWAAWAQKSGAKSDELSSAAQITQEMTSSGQIPHKLFDDAQCIAVIPKLTKAGLVVGGEHGTGVVSCRTSNGWSAPAFISISGGSVGLQAGGEESQIVLLMNKEGEQQLMSGDFKLTGQAAAAGPTGNGYDASTGWKAPMLSYSRSHGAYAGADIQGSTISVDKDAMHSVYGSSETEQNVLHGSVQTPPQAQPFTSALPGNTNGNMH